MLVVFEGIDGSGKATQAKKLQERVSRTLFIEQRDTGKAGIFRSARLVSFPDYAGTQAGAKIRAYLRGEMGELNANDPFLVAMLYALDRFENAGMLLDELLNQHAIVVCDRYTPSNIAHQAAKVPVDRRERLIADIRQLEYTTLQLPEPSMVFYLDITPAESYARTHKRDDVKDIHQDDLRYLAATRDVYLDLAAAGANWHMAQSHDHTGQERSVEEIHAEIWKIFSVARTEHEQMWNGPRGPE